MNVKAVFNTLGKIAVVEGVLLVLPLFVSLVYSEFFSAAIFALTVVFAAAVGGILMLITQRHSHVIYAKEGFAIVAGAWILISLIGALPFKLSGNIDISFNAAAKLQAAVRFHITLNGHAFGKNCRLIGYALYYLFSLLVLNGLFTSFL